MFTDHVQPTFKYCLAINTRNGSAFKSSRPFLSDPLVQGE